MSREILFRGKRLDNGKWTEGNFIRRGQTGLEYIRNNDSLLKVDPATVGQFTGLCDKNGVKIFEGDVLRDGLGDDGIVTYFESIASFRYRVGNEVWNLNEGDPNRPTQLQYTEVIGNIYDKEEQDALQGKFAQDGRCTFDE